MKKIKENTNKRKGFTLIEVLVGMACSLIVIGTITGSLIYVNKVNTELITKSSTFYKVRQVKKYILEHYEAGDYLKVSKDDNGAISYHTKGGKNTMIVTSSKITAVDIVDNDTNYKINDNLYYTTCTITYKENGDKTYKFIVGAYAPTEKTNNKSE